MKKLPSAKVVEKRPVVDQKPADKLTLSLSRPGLPPLLPAVMPGRSQASLRQIQKAILTHKPIVQRLTSLQTFIANTRFTGIGREGKKYKAIKKTLADFHQSQQTNTQLTVQIAYLRQLVTDCNRWLDTPAHQNQKKKKTRARRQGISNLRDEAQNEIVDLANDLIGREQELKTLTDLGVPRSQLDNLTSSQLADVVTAKNAFAGKQNQQARQLLDNLVDTVGPAAKLIGAALYRHYKVNPPERFAIYGQILPIQEPNFESDEQMEEDFLGSESAQNLTSDAVATIDFMTNIETGLAKVTPEEIYSNLLKKFPNIGKRLTKAQAAALYGYTTKDYTFLNPSLRDMRSNEISEFLPYIQTVAASLTHAPAYEGEVYRGVNDKTGELWQLYQVGAVVSDRAFTSTSMSKGKAFGGNIRLKIQSLTGRIVAFNSDRMDEMEVLFPPGVRFKVVAVTINGRTKNVELQELPHDESGTETEMSYGG